MSGRFLTELETRVVSDSDDALEKPLLFYTEVLKRVIVVPAGFVTDYASVPRIPLAYLLAGGHAKKAAVIHDYLYRTPNAFVPPVTRAQADAVFEEAMAASGQPWWRRKLMWLGVRAGGWTAFHEATQEPA